MDQRRHASQLLTPLISAQRQATSRFSLYAFLIHFELALSLSLLCVFLCLYLPEPDSRYISLDDSSGIGLYEGLHIPAVLVRLVC